MISADELYLPECLDKRRTCLYNVYDLSVMRVHPSDESRVTVTKSDYFIRKLEVALIHFGCAALWRKREYTAEVSWI